MLIPCSHTPRQGSLLLLGHGESHNEIRNNGSEQRKSEDCRAEAIIETTLASLPDALRTPMEGEERIQHSHHGDERKQTGANLADLVAEVKQSDSETTEDDGEVEP